MESMVAQFRERSGVGAQIYKLRRELGLTQAELGRRVGTTASAISRIEDADYDAHSSKILVRVANALDAVIQTEADKRDTGDL